MSKLQVIRHSPASKLWQAMSSLLFLAAAIAFPAQASETDFSPFFGEWASDGDAFGMPASSKMSWGYTLNDAFVLLNYKIVMTTPDGNQSVFHGKAHYQDIGNHKARGYWADNYGELHPIDGSFEANVLTAHWGVEGGKQGRSRYALTSNDTMQVTDWIKTEDGWKQFNDNTFTRAAQE